MTTKRGNFAKNLQDMQQQVRERLEWSSQHYKEKEDLT